MNATSNQSRGDIGLLAFVFSAIAVDCAALAYGLLWL
jgi:hypothetical protein